MVIRRAGDGKFAHKHGDEPLARLDQPGLFDKDEAA
jgi:hypothetical protein